MDDYYTLKQIILGLRSTYLDNKKNIRKINSLLTYDKNQIKNISIYIYKLEIYCRYNPIDKKANNLLSRIKKLINKYDEQTSFITKVDNKFLGIKNEDREKLNNIISELTNMDFYKNIDIKDFFFNNDDIIMYLKFTSSIIHCHAFDNFDSKYLCDLYYDSNTDSLIANNLYYDVNLDQIRNTLDLSVERSLLSDYINKILEESKFKDKKIIFPKVVKQQNKKLTYKLHKKNNMIVLSENKIS